MSRIQLALNVSDLDEAIAFYAKLFGTAPAKVRDGYANFAVTEPPLKLVLIAGAGAPGTLNHLGVEVMSTDEVQAAIGRLQAEGLATTVEEQTTCCYAVQDKVWVHGPDAEPWEVYTVLADAPVMRPAAEAAATPGDACCGTPEPVALGTKPAAACCGPAPAGVAAGAAGDATGVGAAGADAVRAAVRERYGAAARTASGCCGPADASIAGSSGFGSALYDDAQLGAVPGAAARASLGCGNPTALASLEAGQVVLDLGSGAGIDLILSSERVGPTGTVYGLDMTPEMLDLARRNIAEAGATNITLLEGTLEDIPLPDASVDVIISNCVINLSPDKPRALQEAFRVLRPGGRFAVSDVVLTRPLPAAAQAFVELWTGCVAGALVDDDYRSLLAAAGFTDIEVVPTLVHDRDAIACFVAGLPGIDADASGGLIDEVAGTVVNAFVRATKP